MVQEHRDDPLLQGLLRHELVLLHQHHLGLLVGGVDPVVRVDEAPESGRELVEGRDGLRKLHKILATPDNHLKDDRIKRR